MADRIRRRAHEARAARARSVAAVIALAVGAGVLPGCGWFDKTQDVLLIGDSIMNQSGDFVAAQLKKEQPLDDIKVEKDAVNGSGLMTPHVYDWSTKITELVN